MARQSPLVLRLRIVNWALLAAVVLYAAVQAIRGDGEGLQVDRESTGSQVKDLLWFALLCGFAAFATLEVVKRLTTLRGRLQYDAVVRWFEARDSTRDLGTLLHFLGPYYKGRAARGPFDLPAEQVAAQLAAAADTALAGRDPESRPTEWLRLPADGADDEMVVARSMRTAVDQLQIAMGEQWRRYVQEAAIAVAGAYGIVFAFAGDVETVDQPRFVLVAAVVGGAAAWLIRDLTAIVEKARR